MRHRAEPCSEIVNYFICFLNFPEFLTLMQDLKSLGEVFPTGILPE